MKIKFDKKKILVIDDEIEIINTIIEILEEANPNFEFYFAKDGINGILAAERHHPDIIISDWDMPGISGIATIKRLKKNEITANIPVVMLTGKMTGSKNLKIALDAGAVDFICKPIDDIELIARIKSMLLLSSYYNDIIKLKSQELTSTAANLVQINEERISIVKKIKEIDRKFGSKNNDLSQELKLICIQISHNIGTNAWSQFEEYFKNAHPAFINNLLAKFSELTPTEIKLAILARMHLSTKDMVAIMNISVESVKTSRYRLRKKLNLDRSDNLTIFLQQF